MDEKDRAPDAHAGDGSATGSDPALRDLLPRLQAVEAELAAMITQYTAGAAAANAESEPAAEEDDDAAASPLSIVVSLLAVFASLVMIAVTFYQMQLDPGAAAVGGTAAAFNQQLVQNMNTNEMYTQYRAYTDYTLNSELQNQLELALADSQNSAPEVQAALAQELAQAQRQAAASSLFFSQRYLNRDGSYDVDRQLGEAWSRAEQQTDLDPQPHYADADSQRSVWMQIMWLLLWLTVSLCIYEVVNYFHEQRKVLRLSFVAAATFTVVAIAVVTVVMMQ